MSVSKGSLGHSITLEMIFCVKHSVVMVLYINTDGLEGTKSNLLRALIYES